MGWWGMGKEEVGKDEKVYRDLKGEKEERRRLREGSLDAHLQQTQDDLIGKNLTPCGCLVIYL